MRYHHDLDEAALARAMGLEAGGGLLLVKKIVLLVALAAFGTVEFLVVRHAEVRSAGREQGWRSAAELDEMLLEFG